MKKFKEQLAVLTLVCVSIISCKTEVVRNQFLADNTAFEYAGRVDLIDSKEAVLIGAASFVKTSVVGDSVEIYIHGGRSHNYVSLVVDGEHLGRFRIDTLTNFTLPVKFKKKAAVHQLEIVKATEASSGPIIFKGLGADAIQASEKSEKKKIEFIGDSITCGAAMDDMFSPCNEGDYHDHHNAYLSYGPSVARTLNTDYLLSSISGWGVYRGWNSEVDKNEAVAAVYANTYLNDEGSKPWDFSTYVPDVVSICLGTNDLSGGNGIKERMPFDTELYVERYIAFIEQLYGYYPKVQIGLLTSPMVSGENNVVLVECLERVLAHFNTKNSTKPIQLFQYDTLYVNGCSYHPGIEDHKAMTDVLLPFYKELLK
ncbi:MAG: GDSL family lipase [Flavobacteriaceae bacterium]|nr:MAG: GDSL family lipase [Flavobacteriaceae bacterium]